MKGGKRKGSGRPELPDEEKKVRRLITFDPDFLKALDKADGKSRASKIEVACTEFHKLDWKKDKV